MHRHAFLILESFQEGNPTSNLHFLTSKQWGIDSESHGYEHLQQKLEIKYETNN